MPKKILAVDDSVSKERVFLLFWVRKAMKL